MKKITSEANSLGVTIVVGGRWHAFDLAQQLHKQGDLHRLITNYPAYFVRKWGIPPKYIVSLPLTFFLVKLIYFFGREPLMMRFQWIIHSWFAHQAAKYLDGSKLIHAWSSWAEPSLRWASKKSIPTVLERSSVHILEQSRLLEEEYIRLNSRWNRTHPKIEQMELREYGLASLIAVPSVYVQESFEKFGHNSSKIQRHILGADLAKFTPKIESDTHLSSALKLLYVGSLTPQKGVHDLLTGFKKFNSKSSILSLLGGGITPEINRLLNINNDSRIKSFGHLPQSQLVDFYREHHLLILPSIQDGFGMVLAQAIACGIPILATTNTGGRDLLELGGSSPIIHQFEGRKYREYPAGWIIPPREPKILTQIFSLLVTNPELLHQKRFNAMQLRKHDLSWASYAASLRTTYLKLLNFEPH